MAEVRVRFAPSPTGTPHIGSLRTALFNFLFAKNQKGKFTLRIEDTDQKRLVKGAVKKIEESLEILNLRWDEYYVQSQRLALYKKHFSILKDKNLVYEDSGAWRFKVEKGKTLSWDDTIHGPIKFQSDVIEDFIIIKSDGFPTYHFASVVDDHDMQISHVLRGDEWLSSTPKHLMLYQAFGYQPPIFVHLPPILGTDKKKLSKRTGAKPVMEYLDEGYLPEAIVNALAFLGWTPKGDRELFSLKELVDEFSLDRINKNSPIFNIEKLNWFNGQWIRKLESKNFIDRLQKFYPDYDASITQAVAPLTQDRMSTLADFKKLTDFFYNRPSNIPAISVSVDAISKIATAFDQNNTWQSEKIKSLIDKMASQEAIDRVSLIAAIRNIVSGTTVTPPLFESLEKLGKKETIERLKNYVNKNKK